MLPGHGFPTDVVSFVNKDQPDKDEDADEDKFRRRSYPSRNLDIAIRDYAPGADIVLDGLVYKSAGVTLNWKRPAGESEVREIQSLKWFWQCRECGAAGTNVIKPDECLSCRSELSPDEAMRSLRPAGFTVDMTVKPHAEIEGWLTSRRSLSAFRRAGQSGRRFLVLGSDGFVRAAMGLSSTRRKAVPRGIQCAWSAGGPRQVEMISERPGPAIEGSSSVSIYEV